MAVSSSSLSPFTHADLLFPACEVDVVVMGGGPVGLATAIEIQHNCPSKKVLVCEKNEYYRRDGIVLSVAKESLRGLSQIESLADITRAWADQRVSIIDLENTLTETAHSLGVNIIKPFQVDPLQLETLFPNAKIYIGADGARSSFRKQLLTPEGDDEFAFNTSHQYIINVQYRITPSNSEEGHSSYPLNKFRLSKYYVHEHRKVLENGDIAVTLQIFVDEEIYNSVSAPFGNPIFLNQTLESLPEKLKNALIIFLGQENGEINQVEQVKNRINVINLRSFCAKNIYSIIAEKVNVVVGDALAAFPFFVAFNNGLKRATHLAKCIKQGFETGSFEACMKEYAYYASWSAFYEHNLAKCKSGGISFAQLLITSESKLPWVGIKGGGRSVRDRIIARGTATLRTLMYGPENAYPPTTTFSSLYGSIRPAPPLLSIEPSPAMAAEAPETNETTNSSSNRGVKRSAL